MIMRFWRSWNLNDNESPTIIKFERLWKSDDHVEWDPQSSYLCDSIDVVGLELIWTYLTARFWANVEFRVEWSFLTVVEIKLPKSGLGKPIRIPDVTRPVSFFAFSENKITKIQLLKPKRYKSYRFKSLFLKSPETTCNYQMVDY